MTTTRGREIRSFCEEHKSNHDAVTPISKDSRTWRSIVLVHGCESNKIGDAKSSRGERVFLDVKGESDVSAFSAAGYRQMEAMLGNGKLRAMYIDKWLADPAKNGEHKDSRTSPGFLGTDRGFRLLARVAKREDVDIVYESGSQGSGGLVVETLLAPIVNIFTAAYPCFLKMLANQRLEGFDKNAVLRKYNLASEQGTVLKSNGWICVPQEWKFLEAYLRRNALRRWFIVTLHELGALALDLSNSEQNNMRWFDGNAIAQNDIRNTTGGGDTFRGALLFGLIQPRTGTEVDHLEHCVNFAMRCATERCRRYKMEDALRDFEKNGFDWWQTAATSPQI